MVGSMYQAKIPPVGSYIYQDRGRRPNKRSNVAGVEGRCHMSDEVGDLSLLLQPTAVRTSYCGDPVFCRCKKWKSSCCMRRDLVARRGQQAHRGTLSETMNR